ncbi:hypothetical protein [Paenibacillus glycinis]|uniref:Uncharacterized protein n=1 Tax=Paenibacillus glycinis TaxID=2697035 RepID=A0ABW9XPS5_9BACL|nr:hypothetical protein [Paenibacillus glycinis]NBD24649.1 hypothetical protein [Paenibacillus glycinis]
MNKSGVDELEIEIYVEVSQAYKNVSKYKRIMVPVVEYRINLSVNARRFNEDEDEVFVVAAFFDSLPSMYTCSCGLFGCGGFYVNVRHGRETVTWDAEQSTTMRFVFSKQNVLRVAEKLLEKLLELNALLLQNGLPDYHELDVYRANTAKFAQTLHSRWQRRRELHRND